MQMLDRNFESYKKHGFPFKLGKPCFLHSFY